MVLTWIDATGAKTLGFLNSSRVLLEDLYLTFRSALFGLRWGGGLYPEECTKQIYFTGVQALIPVAFLAASLGAFAGFYTNAELGLFGNDRIFSRLLTQLLVRDVGPLIVALLVVARSGTAIASELGGMQVNREVEALRMLCIDPYAYLIFPRVAGGSLAVLSLGVFFSTILLFSSCLASYFATGIAPVFSLGQLTQNWDMSFFIVLASKYLLPALFVFTISCHQGLSIKRGSFEVPQVTSRAVLQSIFVILVLHIGLTVLQNFSWIFGRIIL